MAPCRSARLVPRVRARGFSLAELLVGLALAAGPVIVAVQLIHANMIAARFNQERATARMVLLDLLEVLSGEKIEQLRPLAAAGADALDERLGARIDQLPGSTRRQYREQVRPFRGRLELTLTEGLDARAPNLVRMTLAVRLQGGTRLAVTRLFRR